MGSACHVQSHCVVRQVACSDLVRRTSGDLYAVIEIGNAGALYLAVLNVVEIDPFALSDDTGSL